MEQALKELLMELCVDWGFCLPKDHQATIAKQPNYDALKFAFDVLKAEGMDPEIETKWVRQLSRKFIERFGSESISISDF